MGLLLVQLTSGLRAHAQDQDSSSYVYHLHFYLLLPISSLVFLERTPAEDSEAELTSAMMSTEAARIRRLTRDTGTPAEAAMASAMATLWSNVTSFGLPAARISILVL